MSVSILGMSNIETRPVQGDLALLQDLVAEMLLTTRTGAHLAYNWRDGTPRLVPMGFFWNGQEIVMATAVDSPKTKVLTDGAQVAVTIEGDGAPPKVLPIRGTVRVDTVEGIAPEYAAMIRKAEGEKRGNALLEQWAPLYPRQTRIFIRPEWVGVLDFETRGPSAVERAARRLMAEQG